MSFSLRTAFTAFVYAALTSAFCVTVNILWSQLVFLLTLVLVIFAAIAAVLGPPVRRSFRGCFAFATGTYLALAVLSPTTNDFFLVGSLIGRTIVSIDAIPSVHDALMAQTRQDPNFMHDLTVGSRTIANCLVALALGLVAGGYGRRLWAAAAADNEGAAGRL